MSWKQIMNKMAWNLARRSGRGQAENTSAETQIVANDRYIEENGLEKAGQSVITETAYIPENRKQFKMLIRDGMKAGVMHFIFYTSSRETRNHVDAAWTERLVKEGKIVIHYVSDNRVFWKGTPDSDWNIRDLQTAGNINESRIISTRVKDAQQTKMRRGIFPFTWVALGYRHKKDQDVNGTPLKGTARLIVDPSAEKVKLVQREFHLRAQGLSYEQIREANLLDGIVPPMMIRKYNKSSIQRRLNNRLYWGEVHDKKNDKIYPGTHPLIIDSHILKIVDLVNKGATRKGLRPKPMNHDGGHFRHFFRCGNDGCGCSITYELHEKPDRENKGVKLYDLYRCTNAKKLHDKNRSINESDIWSIVDFALCPFQISEKTASALTLRLAQHQDLQANDLRREMKAIQSELEKNAERRRSTVELFRNSEVIKRDFDEQIKILTEQEENLNRWFANANKKLRSLEQFSSSIIKQTSSSFDLIWNQMSRAEKANLLRIVTESATISYVQETGSLEVVLRFKNHFSRLTGWKDVRSFKCKKINEAA